MAAGLIVAATGAFPPRSPTCSARAFALLLAVALAVFSQSLISAVDIIVDKEVSVDNGTDLTLKCSFNSKDPITSAASVTWTYKQAGSSNPPITLIFVSGGRSYPSQHEQFKARVNWAGSILKKSASIKIIRMSPQDNGSYYCDVKNPPDIFVQPGEIRVRVLVKEIPTPKPTRVLSRSESTLPPSKTTPAKAAATAVATTTTTTTTTTIKNSTAVGSASTVLPLEIMAKSKAVLFSLLPFLFSGIVVSGCLF